jgi:hypothetical protein
VRELFGPDGSGAGVTVVHIVGKRLNPPTDEFRLFARDAHFNRRSYRILESVWIQWAG